MSGYGCIADADQATKILAHRVRSRPIWLKAEAHNQALATVVRVGIGSQLRFYGHLVHD
jgi:hypothetical protein